MAQDILLKENLNASDSEDQSSITTITDSEFDNFNQKNDNSNCEDFRNAKEIMQKNQKWSLQDFNSDDVKKKRKSDQHTRVTVVKKYYYKNYTFKNK